MVIHFSFFSDLTKSILVKHEQLVKRINSKLLQFAIASNSASLGKLCKVKAFSLVAFSIPFKVVILPFEISKISRFGEIISEIELSKFVMVMSCSELHWGNFNCGFHCICSIVFKFSKLLKSILMLCVSCIVNFSKLEKRYRFSPSNFFVVINGYAF